MQQLRRRGRGTAGPLPNQARRLCWQGGGAGAGAGRLWLQLQLQLGRIVLSSAETPSLEDTQAPCDALALGLR